MACLEHEEAALKTAREPDILAAAREQEAILTQLAALPPGEGEENAADLAALKRRVGAQLSRNRAIITAALELIQDFLDVLTPPGPGLYQQAGRLQTGTGSHILHRQV